MKYIWFFVYHFTFNAYINIFIGLGKLKDISNCIFTKSNALPRVFAMFFKFSKYYQIVQSVSYNVSIKYCSQALSLRFVAVMAIPLKEVLVKIHAQINFLAKWNIQRVIQSEKQALSFNKHHTHIKQLWRNSSSASVYIIFCDVWKWYGTNRTKWQDIRTSPVAFTWKKLYCSNKNMEPFTSIPFFWKWK